MALIRAFGDTGMKHASIREWCRMHAEEQIALLKTLASIPSPSHHEEKRVAFLLSWLWRHGFTAAYTDDAKNVIVPFACKERNDILVFAAHTDIVFPDTEPLPVTESDGRLYAPGIGDDTANVTALLMCALFLQENPPSVPLLLVFDSCEEGLGNLKGTRALFDAYAGRIRAFVSFDGQYTGLVHRAVGSERWLVTARAAGGHSYGAFGNTNAIAAMAGLITDLYRQPVPAAEDRKTTYNVGTINGGTSVNSIAETAEITYEYRSDDRDMLLEMRRQFFERLAFHQQDDVRWKTELLGERPCGDAADAYAEQALLKRCSDVIASVTGRTPQLRASSTDCNIPFSRGIPATAFGLYLGAKSHTREEFVERDSLQTGLEIALTLLTEWVLETEESTR